MLHGGVKIYMKKIFLVVLVLFVSLYFAACDSKQQNETDFVTDLTSEITNDITSVSEVTSNSIEQTSSSTLTSTTSPHKQFTSKDSLTESTTLLTTKSVTTQSSSETTIILPESTITEKSLKETTLYMSDFTTTQQSTEEMNTISETSVPIEYPFLEPLTEEATEKIKQDFAVFKSSEWETPDVEKIKIIHYYGTYNGNEVVVVWSSEYDMTADEKEIVVSDYIFTVYSGSFDIWLHKNSSFVDINTAYENKYLSDNDIATIYFYANN